MGNSITRNRATALAGIVATITTSTTLQEVNSLSIPLVISTSSPPRQGSPTQLFFGSNYIDDLSDSTPSVLSSSVEAYNSGVITGTTFSRGTIPTKSTDIKKRKASPKIDSDLLRFMSAQNPIPIPISSSLKYTNGTHVDGRNGIIGTIDANGYSTRLTGQQPPAWMGQFQVEYVAEVLIACGADADAAFVAGAAVQNHAFERMRRRSIHRFLKDRDELWATYTLINAAEPTTWEGVPSIAASSSSNSIMEQDVFQDELPRVNNLDEVIALLTQAGANGSDMASILTHTPSISMMRTHKRTHHEPHSGGESLEETIERVITNLLFTTLKLRKNEVRKVLRLCPRLLTVKGSHEAEQVVTLMSSLGSSPKALVRDKRFLVHMLSRSPTSLFRFVAFLSSNAVCMRVKDIGSFLRKPGSLELMNSLCPAMHTLRLYDDSNNKELNSLSQPALEAKLRHEIDRTYKRATQTAFVLRHELGVDDMGKLLSAYPGILLLDPETDIFPVADFLHTDLGLCDLDVPRVLQSYPNLLKTDVTQMQETVDYFIELEVEPNALAKIFRAFPSMLLLDKKTKMEPVVQFLREIGVVNVGRFVTRLPAVLGYSVEEDLRPKWRFLTEICGFDYFEVVRFPAYFSYPLSRIQDRYQYLHMKGISFRLAKLDSVLRFGDKDFASSIAGDKDAGTRFKEFTKQQSQISQQKVQKKTASRASKPVSPQKTPPLQKSVKLAP